MKGLKMSENEQIEKEPELVDNAPMENEETHIEERFDRGELMHRAGAAEMVEEDDRRVRMSISSEEPVERSFGLEVLRHERRRSRFVKIEQRPRAIIAGSRFDKTNWRY